jgi:hypothetical protein
VSNFRLLTSLKIEKIEKIQTTTKQGTYCALVRCHVDVRAGRGGLQEQSRPNEISVDQEPIPSGGHNEQRSSTLGETHRHVCNQGWVLMTIELMVDLTDALPNLTRAIRQRQQM